GGVRRNADQSNRRPSASIGGSVSSSGHKSSFADGSFTTNSAWDSSRILGGSPPKSPFVDGGAHAGPASPPVSDSFRAFATDWMQAGLSYFSEDCTICRSRAEKSSLTPPG